jgi:hypothetical protein
MTTATPLKINQLALHEACNHDSRLTGIVLALLEVVTGEEETFNALNPITNQHIEHYRQQLRQAIGVSV